MLWKVVKWKVVKYLYTVEAPESFPWKMTLTTLVRVAVIETSLRSPQSCYRDRRINAHYSLALGDVQPFIFVFQNFAYRAALSTELGSNVLLPGIGKSLTVQTYRPHIRHCTGLLSLVSFRSTRGGWLRAYEQCIHMCYWCCDCSRCRTLT